MLVAVDDEDRYPRWQGRLIEQLGYAINLMLAFAVTALAYDFTLLRDKTFKPDALASSYLRISIGGLALASFFGLLCVVNRLRDFRGTAQRAREIAGAPSKKELQWVGQNTWWLFYLELGGFAIGVLALGLALWETYGSKLG